MAPARRSTVVVLGARVDVVDVYIAVAIAVVVVAFASEVSGYAGAPRLAAMIAAAVAAGWLIVGRITDRVKR